MKSKDVSGDLEYYVEHGYPYVGATLVAAASLWMSQAHKAQIATDLASPVLNIIAIIVGFVAAVVTFLLTAQDVPILVSLRTTKSYDDLVAYHWAAVFWGFLAAIMSLVVLASCRFQHVQLRSVIFHIWVWLGALTTLLFFRVFWFLRRALKPTPLEQSGPEPECENAPRPE